MFTVKKRCLEEDVEVFFCGDILATRCYERFLECNIVTPFERKNSTDGNISLSKRVDTSQPCLTTTRSLSCKQNQDGDSINTQVQDKKGR